MKMDKALGFEKYVELANYPWAPRIWGKEENFEWMFLKEYIIYDRR